MSLKIEMAESASGFSGGRDGDFHISILIKVEFPKSTSRLALRVEIPKSTSGYELKPTGDITKLGYSRNRDAKKQISSFKRRADSQ